MSTLSALQEKGVLSKYGEQIEFNKIFKAQLDIADHVTLEEYIEGNFVKYMNNTCHMAVMDGHETLCDKAASFADYSYEKSNQKLMVVDLQGNGYMFFDPEIATTDLLSEENSEVMSCAGNLSTLAIDNFLSLHTCNQFRKMLEL